MDRRLLAVAGVALLATTAGCSLLGGGTATPTPTEQPTATPTDAPFEYPEGFAASGVTDGATAAETHRAAITDLDSFTVTYDATLATGNETITVDYDQPSDLADQRALLQFRVSSEQRFYGSTTQFYTADTVYVRSKMPRNETTYSNESQAFNESALAASQFVGPLLTDVRYGEATVLTRNGEPMARYEATELVSARAVFGEGITTENVSSFSATLWVDADGVVRRVEYSATVDQGDSSRSVDATIQVSGIGDTAVERPDWVDRA